MTRLSTFADAQTAAEHAAHEIADALREALERRGVAHLALAGGNTPRPAYELLATLLDDWSAVELWYGDERCVGPEDPESNHQLVADTLLAHIRGAAPREHRILGELGPETAAQMYDAELRAELAPAAQGAPPALDLALLGIGEDGHTASLFPSHPEVEDSSGALCLPVRDAPKPPPERVTLSLPVLRAARSCLLLVAGAGKADALAAVLAETGMLAERGMRAAGECLPASVGGECLPASVSPDPRLPASLLASERLYVVADAAAAARIDSSDSSEIPGEASAR